MTTETTEIDAAVARVVRAQVPALYLLLDGEDVIVEANRHTRELLGGAVVGARFADLLTTFDRQDQTGGLDRASDAPRLCNVMTFTGLPQSFLCWFSRVGDRVVVVGGIDPASAEALRQELLRANQELSVRGRELCRANAELTHLGEMRDTFFGMAAHDLRQPLSAILLLAEILSQEAGPALAPEDREHLRAIHASAELMLGVVRGFLESAIIGAGRLRVAPAPASLDAIVDRAVRVVKPVATRKRVQLRVERGDLPPLALDAAKMEEVVVNLVKNAVEHSFPEREIVVATRRDGDAAVLRVTDTGTGIPESLLGHLFSAYATGENKTASERSTGLGLAICRMIVEAHGGRVDAESAPGEGTTLSVRLPMNRGAPATAGRSSS